MMPDNLDQVRARALCLFDEAAVEAALDRMAAGISARLSNSNPLILCVMSGGLIITGRLATRLHFPLQMDYIHATRYQNTTRGKELHWKAMPALPLAGRVVLVVDDILDEGVTLRRILDWCHEQQASEVYSAVLVDKQHDRKHSALKADFTGLEVDDHYLFGYGMDYKGYLRNCPGIFAVHPDDLSP